MSLQSRRNFIKTLSLGAAAGVAGGSASTQAQVQSQESAEIPDAFATDAEMRPLPYEPGELEGMSERLIQSHWENNYGGSVNALNIIKQRIRDALEDDDYPAFVYNDLKKEHLARTGSVVLHEYYFENMAPPGQRDGEVDQALSRAFGSADAWEREFRRIGAGLSGGSGWVMLAWNFHSRTLENYWMSGHTTTPAASAPILVMDMYEHSYHMDFATDAGQYIEAFIRNINWGVVAGRLEGARQGMV